MRQLRTSRRWLLLGVLALLLMALTIPIYAQEGGDLDGDGVPDEQDECPETPGPAENGGCPWPDGDQDGVPDKDDLCPNEPGLIDYHGCPWQDTDDDGIGDLDDACPRQPGPAYNQGCPNPDDQDGDGTPDGFDQCPLDGGPSWNNGCPTDTVPTDVPGDDIPDNPPPVFVPDIPSEGQCKAGVSGTVPVNIRAEPSLNGAVVGLLQPGTTVNIFDEVTNADGTWYRIAEGWIASWVVISGGRCGFLTFPDPDGGPGEDLPPQQWDGIEVGGAVCPDFILYHSNPNGGWNIFSLKDGESTNLTQQNEFQDIQPSYSEDAQWVVFTSDRDRGNWEIYVVPADGSNTDPLRMTFNTGVDNNPVWGPADTGIIFESNREGNWDLWLFDVAGSGLTDTLDTQLTFDPADDLNAVWSPDGETIYFQSNRDDDWELYALTLGEEEPVKLTDNEVDDVDPIISHDGTLLAFRRINENGRYDLWLLDLATGEERQLTFTPGSIFGPQFASSDTFLVFYLFAGEGFDLMAVDVEGETLKNVTSSALINDMAPAFRCGTDTVIFNNDEYGQTELLEIDPLPLDGPSAAATRLTERSLSDDIFALGEIRVENNSSTTLQ